MPINDKFLPIKECRGYDLLEAEGGLVVTLQRGFETNRAVEGWATHLLRACTGPYRAVWIDLGLTPTLSSTLIAGLIQVADHLGPKTSEGVILVQASQRALLTLRMMQVEALFRYC